VWAEALGDIRLIAPDLPERQIIDELQNLRCARLFGEFRGSAASDLAAVARVVSALGQLMMWRQDIVEVDINPLVVHPDGVTALDVLIITAEGEHA
jgi:succinyl-CoA synthetase beta subunit